MDRRAVLCLLGGAMSFAVSGCLDLEFGNDDTDGTTGDGTSDTGDDGSETDSGAGDSNDGDSSSSGDGGNGESGGNGTEGDEASSGDDGTGTDDVGGDDGGGDTTPAEPSLAVSVEPGLAGNRNDYTLTVDGVDSVGTAISELAVSFDEGSGLEPFILRTVSVDDVRVTLAGTEELGLEGVRADGARGLLIALADRLVPSDVDGETVVTIRFLRAPEPGEFGISLLFRNNTGEEISELEATYAISESP